MNLNTRRDFIRRSAMAMGAISVCGLPVSCSSGKERLFRYAFCNEILGDISWPEQCEIIGSAGYTGVEIAPFTLVDRGVDEITPAGRLQMFSDMKNAGIECAGLHWLFVPPPEGLHFTSPDDTQRRFSVNYLVKLIDFCGDMGGEIMVFGSPRQRGTIKGITVSEAMNYFVDGLAHVADHALQRGVTILIEPLPARSTDIVNTMSEALGVIKRIGHPSVSTMFDFHNTEDETLPLHELVAKYYDHIHHVHFQNMDGTVVLSDAIPEEFIPVFEVLRKSGFSKWISLEVFDYSPGGEHIAIEGMKTFLEIERRIA